MSRASVNLIGFVVVMVVVPWSLILLMRTAGRRWGTGISRTWRPARPRLSGRCIAA